MTHSGQSRIRWRTLRNQTTEEAKAVPDLQGVEKRKQWSVSAIAFEVFAIVLGVLLALGLSEWADDRQHKMLANSALQNIAKEIESNLGTLELIHENNLTTVEAITSQSASGTDESRSIIPGIQLQETAWEAFIAAGLSGYADYDKILKLSQMYAIQRVYKQTGMQVSESAMNATAYSAATGTVLDDQHFQEQFIGYFQLLTQLEAQLLAVYHGALESFD